MEVCFIQVKWLTSSVPLIWLQVFAVCLRFSLEECYMTSKHSNFFPGVTEYFTAADLITWWLRIVGRRNQAVNSSQKLMEICAAWGWLYSLPKDEDEWGKQQLLSPVKKWLCSWLPQNQRKWGLGGINFYFSLLRQKWNIFQSFCNSVLFPKRTKKKECGCVFFLNRLYFCWFL